MKKKVKNITAARQQQKVVARGAHVHDFFWVSGLVGCVCECVFVCVAVWFDAGGGRFGQGATKVGEVVMGDLSVRARC